ncbi:hypothetical protein Ntsu_26790 [Nocardia sp. IFM 10818]
MNGALPGTHGWRVANSLWIIPTFLCGFLTWTSFLYIGVRTKNRSWLISAAVYAAATVGLIVLLSLGGPTDADVAAAKAPPRTRTQETISDWGSGALIAVWLGGIVHALLARPHYLHRLHTAQQQRPPMPVYPNPIRNPQGPTWLTGDPQQYWTGPSGPPPQHPVPPGPAYRAGPPVDTSQQVTTKIRHAQPAVAIAATGRVPVNTASAEQLSALGLDAGTVVAVLEARDSGGIRDLRQFSSASGLKPHELQRIADRLDFSGTAAAAQPPHALGRRLDL